MQIEPFEFAPEWIKNMVAPHKPEIFAWFRLFNEDMATKYPALRDRTKEVKQMIDGYITVGQTHRAADCVIVEHTLTGAQLKEYGFDAVGAQYAQEFRIIVGYL